MVLKKLKAQIPSQISTDKPEERKGICKISPLVFSPIPAQELKP